MCVQPEDSSGTGRSETTQRADCDRMISAEDERYTARTPSLLDLAGDPDTGLEDRVEEPSLVAPLGCVSARAASTFP